KPEPDDLLVFQTGLYGHVAIITKVDNDSIEIIQQNIYAKPRETFKLEVRDGHYFLGDGKQPVGWLRKQTK
ncbi:MAG TPA: CHAP domain-containing protein, partial [Paenibacillaceae bacterium]|nr:CHAP domain-containing protein [Paenibacillaceae bacterium]